MKTHQKGFAGIAALIAVVIAIIAGGAYVVWKNGQSDGPVPVETVKVESVQNSTTTTVTKVYDVTQNTVTNGATTSQIHITAPVTTTVDCGDQNCFNQKFATCDPSTLKAESPLGSVAYRIIGPVSDGCQMTFKYTKNPNPAWVEKEMTCSYDNKLPFQDSFQKTFTGVVQKTVKCIGPLYEVLIKL